MSDQGVNGSNGQWTKQDFVSSSDVRWCPRCGDYAILSAIQKVFPTLGIPREKFVIVSGIGCSSRFPYYMNTYGFHTIHGRGPAVATGIKVANPELSVWLITGDGDGLSIGAGHLMHILRRNVDVNILLFNNRIYGLTKGQYSPTSELGKKTKTTPMGSIDYPINPLCFAIASEATFIARALDTNPKHMGQIFEKSARHKGVSFIEILQNCVIFNDKAFEDISSRSVREDHLLLLEDGKPLMFGKEKNKGIMMKGLKPVVATVGEDGVSEDDFLIHNNSLEDPVYSYLLTQMNYPKYPTPVGVFRSIESKATYNELFDKQVVSAPQKKSDKKTLFDLLRGTESWEVHSKGGDISTVDTDLEESSATSFLQDDIVKEKKYYSKKVRSHYLFRIIREPLSLVIENVGLETPSIQYNASISEAISFFKKEIKVSALLVFEKDQFKGILSERDIMLKVALKKLNKNSLTVDSVMLNREPKVLNHKMKIGFAINQMALGGYRHVPVVYKKKLTLLSIKDVLIFIHNIVKEKSFQ